MTKCSMLLMKIMSEHVAIEGGAWVDSKEIKATVERWMEVMTPRQIAVAADEAVTSVRSWATGNHRVLRTKWRRVVPQVEQMCEIIQAQHIETLVPLCLVLLTLMALCLSVRFGFSFTS